jgi:basic membrane protein A
MFRKLASLLLIVFLLAPVLSTVTLAQTIQSVCLITDIGRINDGTFNEFAYDGMLRAVDEFGLESTFIETQAPSDYEDNINVCLDGDYDIIITVGFALADAARAAAEANPDVFFIGVDQDFTSAEPLSNLVGLQFREDQAGFLVGAMAALMTESGIVAGVYGAEIFPVIKFRNGFEQGVAYINPDVSTLGVYIPDFQAPDQGQEAAIQFIGEGADVIFGAGGPTGSGGIAYAATQDVLVIGVDQDEYFTTFGGGESPGAENLITSAIKRVDNGVYDMISAAVTGEGFPENSTYVLEIANDGIDFAPPHDADVPQEVIDQVTEIREMLREGSVVTGVDPVTGEMLEGDMQADDEMGMNMAGSITSACLVTDQGGVNDGTFNELAANAIGQAAEDFGIETSILESNTPDDFTPNINTCLDSGAGAIVTVGFLLADATLEAAMENEEVFFIGVDQFFMDHPSNLVGLQFREDQAGFLAGALAALISESGTIGGVYGQEIPPVIKFRNGFELGAAYVNPDIVTVGAYIDSFVDPAAGQELAEALIGEGADMIFGAGGATGSGGISFAAQEGVMVIGVDQDEYFTTFGGGESPGSENIITSAVKRVDVGVYNMLAALIDGSVEWAGGSLYILDASNGGVGLAPSHDADVPQEFLDAVVEIEAQLADGTLTTGVDPVTGALLDE